MNITLFGFEIYYLFYFFVIYAFIGWVTEVIFAFNKHNCFVNRGFLNGPFCPIYGFGMLTLIVFLNPVKDNLMFLFISSFILTSLLEYITGFALEKSFDNKWWDYSNQKYNIKGRICLRFSVYWGIAGLVIVKLIHPYIQTIVKLIPIKYGSYLAYGLTCYFIVDFIITVNLVIRFNKRIKQLYDISMELKPKLDSMIEARKDIVEDRLELGREELRKIEAELSQRRKELKIKYEQLLNRKPIINSRIIRAFPSIESNKFDKVLKDIKNRIETNKRFKF